MFLNHRWVNSSILWILKSSAAPTLEEVSLQRPKMKDMETRVGEMGTRCVTSGRARGCRWQHWPRWALPAQPGRKWRDGRWLSFPSSFHQGQIGACVRNPKMAALARTLGPPLGAGTTGRLVPPGWGSGGVSALAAGWAAKATYQWRRCLELMARWSPPNRGYRLFPAALRRAGPSPSPR